MGKKKVGCGPDHCRLQTTFLYRFKGTMRSVADHTDSDCKTVCASYGDCDFSRNAALRMKQSNDRESRKGHLASGRDGKLPPGLCVFGFCIKGYFSKHSENSARAR